MDSTNIQHLTDLITKQGEDWATWKAGIDKRMALIEKDSQDRIVRAQRPNLSNEVSRCLTGPETWIDVQTRRPVPVL